MDRSAVLRELESWPLEDQIRLVQEAWDQIADRGAEPELSAAQRALIDERLERLAVSPEECLSWEEIRKRVRSGR